MKIKDIQKPDVSNETVPQLKSIFVSIFTNNDGSFDYFSIGQWIAQCVTGPVEALSGLQANAFGVITALSQTQTGSEVQQSPNFALLKGFLSNCDVSTKIGAFMAGFMTKSDN